MLSSNEALARSLIEEVQMQVESECAEVLKSAEDEAKDIVAAAFASAHARGYEAIMAMRQEGRRRLIQAEARRQTRERMLKETMAAEALRYGLPLLEKAVLKRWQDSASRRLWLEAAARQASSRLIPGRWTVEHPLDVSSEEKQHFLAFLGDVDAGSVGFETTSALKAGIRVHAEGAVLDASSYGLLADKHAIEAMLLAELSHAFTPAKDAVKGPS
ncbi:MAG: hypothetical protein ACLP7P_11360 [Rhodomicrobium sp.]